MPHTAGLCGLERTAIESVLGGTVAAVTCHSKWHEWLTWYLTIKAEQSFVSRNAQWSAADPVLNCGIHSNFSLLFPSTQSNLCPQILAWIFPKQRPAWAQLSSAGGNAAAQGRHSSPFGSICVIYCIPCNVWVTLYNLICCGLHCSSSFRGNWRRQMSVLMLLDYHRKSFTAAAQRHKLLTMMMWLKWINCHLGVKFFFKQSNFCNGLFEFHKFTLPIKSNHQFWGAFHPTNHCLSTDTFYLPTILQLGKLGGCDMQTVILDKLLSFALRKKVMSFPSRSRTNCNVHTAVRGKVCAMFLT